VKPGVVRIWAHRGLLARQGTDARGRTLYSLVDAFRLQAELHRRRVQRA
jgi:hypothetical protein